MTLVTESTCGICEDNCSLLSVLTCLTVYIGMSYYYYSIEKVINQQGLSLTDCAHS